jgi:hypothetical protein
LAGSVKPEESLADELAVLVVGEVPRTLLGTISEAVVVP